MATSGGFTPPGAAAQDFWRSPAANGAQPDGVTDVTETVARTGAVGVGLAVATAPVAMVDIADGARSGTHGNTALTPLYASGTLPAVGNGAVSPPATPTDGVEFRHSNGTQGVGFGYHGMYATGSAADQSMAFLQRGAGQYFQYWQTLLGGVNYHNNVGPAIAANEGFDTRWWAAGTQEFAELRRRSPRVVPGGALGGELYFQQRQAGGGFSNALSMHPSSTTANAHRIEISENDVSDDKLVLYGTNSTAFFGFGIKGSTLASFVNANTGHWRFYQGASPGTQVFGVSGLGNVTVDPLGVAPSGWNAPVLRFGGEGSDEGIRSQRVGADRFLEDVEVFTSSARRFAVLANGRLYAAVVPVFASDALAGAGGLATGEIYKDALGILHIKA